MLQEGSKEGGCKEGQVEYRDILVKALYYYETDKEDIQNLIVAQDGQNLHRKSEIIPYPRRP